MRVLRYEHDNGDYYELYIDDGYRLQKSDQCPAFRIRQLKHRAQALLSSLPRRDKERRLRAAMLAAEAGQCTMEGASAEICDALQQQLDSMEADAFGAA